MAKSGAENNRPQEEAYLKALENLELTANQASTIAKDLRINHGPFRVLLLHAAFPQLNVEEVASRLCISEHTARNHWRNIHGALGTNKQTAAISQFMEKVRALQVDPASPDKSALNLQESVHQPQTESFSHIADLGQSSEADEDLLKSRSKITQLLPRWWKRALYITAPLLILLLGGLFLFLWLFSQTKPVFPQFGFGRLHDNFANVAMMEHKLLPCQEGCPEGNKKVLDVEATLETAGYAVVNFKKLLFFKTDLGPLLLLKIAVKTHDPNFEVGLWDDTRRVFFDCKASRVGQVDDFLINLDEKELTENGVNYRPQRTQGFSIGFAHDAGTGPGRHHMEVHGIVSGDSFPGLSQDSLCLLRRPGG